jgi:hypothetical protein
MWRRLCRDDGIALIVALMAMMLLLPLGAALTLITTTETRIAANYRDGLDTLYAADAGVELAVSELRRVPNWADVLNGMVTSALTATIEPAGAPPRDENGRPWRLYASGRLADMLGDASSNSQVYVAVWVAGDPLKNDVLTVRASAHGPGATRRNVEVTIARVAGIDPAAEPEIRRLSWRER